MEKILNYFPRCYLQAFLFRNFRSPATQFDENKYEGEMPSYKNLEDEEIMNILDYIRVTSAKTKG